MRLSGEPYTVIGVLPREAVFPDQVDLWVPLAADPNESDGWYLNGIGRLKHDVSIEQARADLLRVHQTVPVKENKITQPVITHFGTATLVTSVSRVTSC